MIQKNKKHLKKLNKPIFFNELQQALDYVLSVKTSKSMCTRRLKKMEWIVIDTVICSSSGITFSTVWCKIKLILWYQSDVFLPPGSVFTPVNSGSGVILDNKLLPITIYNVTPFNRNFWFIIKNNKECPGKSVKRKCPNNNCVLVICPYGHK